MTRLAASLTAGAFASMAVAAWACDGLQADSAWVRQPPPASTHTAGYVSLRNTGASALSVVEVTSPDFETAALHETVHVDGRARMQPVDRIELAPGAVLEARPGGIHLMLGGARRALTESDTVTLAFECANGGTAAAVAPVLRHAPD